MCTDSYKLSHWVQYPAGISMVYSNFTPRRSMIPNTPKMVFFGLQAFLMKLTKRFADDFFGLDRDIAVGEFVEQYTEFFAAPPDPICVERVSQLWDLGYLPLCVKALPEGSAVPHGIPAFTIENTHPGCFWLTNFVESWMSAEIWHPCTSATTSWEYRKVFDAYAKETSDADFMPAFQGHDFSFRGLEGLEAAMASGAAHLLSSFGTDNCPALNWIHNYYPGDNGLVGTSVPATEHSVMCAGGEENELETISRLLDTYPSGILSIVSDSWDFWKAVTVYYPALKDRIMARDGKIVIRPDSSPKTPVEIICGDPEAPGGTPEHKGLCQCLYETFGGTVNSKGYIELDPHIGMIYGDSITRTYQMAILERLKKAGFASTNIVLGIGSYTYQMATRDSHGIAIKATAVKIDGQVKAISKDPKTDNSGKKSAKGLLVVDKIDGEFVLTQDAESGEGGLLGVVYLDGELLRKQSFAQVREVLRVS